MNRFLGDFIENLDKKQLNIGIWGGKLFIYKSLNLISCQWLIDSSDVWMTAVGGNAWRYAQLHFVSVISVISYSIFISLHSHLTYWCVLYFFDEISGRLIGFSFAATILNNQCRERFAVVWKKKTKRAYVAYQQTAIIQTTLKAYWNQRIFFVSTVGWFIELRRNILLIA